MPPTYIMNWPKKNDREKFEIDGFIEAYPRLPDKKQFKVVAKSEKPDWIVVDLNSGEEYGVETTAVYSDDKSVPENHITWNHPGDSQQIPSSKAAIEQYKQRLVDSIQVKIQKARNGYDSSRPLILSIYANEYVSIFLTEEHLNSLVRDNTDIFDQMHPFSEIVIWSLPNDGIFRIRP